MKSILPVSGVYDIPYIADPSRGQSRYVDLRLHPGEMRTIPELNAQPLLRDLVTVLNRKDGLFMTHGSAFALERPGSQGGQIPLSIESQAATHWCTSYVTLSFWQMSLNTPDEQTALYDRFTSDANGTEVCFVIQPAYFLTLFEQRFGSKWIDKENATICLIWASGWGESTAVAKSRWRNVIKNLIEFFGGFTTSNDKVDAAAVTISQHLLNESSTPTVS